MAFLELKDFFKRYFAYYKALENDFLATERFVTIAADNFGTYSIEFIKLLQTTCSEVESVAKYLCSLLDPTKKCANINACCKIIIDSNNLFPRATTTIPQLDDMIVTPWFGWSYTTITDKNGKQRINADNPEWWKKYNKVKHNRNEVDKSTKQPNYKYANQGNVLNAIAALYILNSYTIFKLCKNADKETSSYFLDEWTKGTRLFDSFLVANL